MSIIAGQVTLGTAATLIHDATNSDKCEITVHSATKDVYIGESDVTISNGFQVGNDVSITLKVGRNDAIYGVVDSGTHTISYWVYTPN